MTLDDPARLTRRTLLWSAGAGMAALGLAACGGGAGTAAPSGAAATGGFPVTISGAEGDAVIPAQPTRVVAAGLQRDTDIALALGVTPVGIARAASFPSGIAPWVEFSGPAPELLDGSSGALPLEQVAALRPDLILAVDDYALATNYAQYSQIAPTVSYVQAQNVDTWQESTRRIAQALGRSGEADGVIERAEGAVTAAAAATPALAGRTFSFSVVYSGVIYTVVTGDAAEAVLSDLGMTLAPAVAGLPESATAGRAEVSAEQVSVLDADVLLMSYATDADRAAIEGNAVFAGLPSVTRGSYVALDFPVAVALAFPSPLATPWAVERIVPVLTGALRS